MLMLLHLLGGVSAHAQSFDVIHTFGGTLANNDPDGQDPGSNLIYDASGNLYGTCEYGGKNITGGNLWEITSEGVYIDLYDFNAASIVYASGKSGQDGRDPRGPIVWDPANNTLYGTCYIGAGGSDGMLWSFDLTTSVYKDLHDFGVTLSDGENPVSGVTLSSAGVLYGTCLLGGNLYRGMIWKYTISSGAYADIHDFGGTITNADGSSGYDGSGSEFPVTLDPQGDLFGTTGTGGASEGQGVGSGMVYELSAAGLYFDLHDFGLNQITYSTGATGIDGSNPYCAVAIDKSGNLYGTVPNRGAYTTSQGFLWEITGYNRVNGKPGTYHDLQDFGGGVSVNGDSHEGVVIDSKGNLYGSTENSSTIWEYTPVAGAVPSSYQVLRTFVNSTDGTYPSQPTLDAYGNVYGVTATGAVAGGTAWVLAVGKLTTLTFSPSSVVGQLPSTGTVSISVPAPAGGLVIGLQSNLPGAAKPATPTITIPAGKTSATFTIDTFAEGASTPVQITASLGSGSLVETLTVLPLIQSLTFSPPTELAGLVANCTVTLAAAQKTGTVINLDSDGLLYENLNQITVPAGSTSYTFPVPTSNVGNNLQPNTLTATLSGASAGVTATLNMITGQLQLSPTSAVGGSAPVNATISLSAPAPSGGFQVPLYSSSSAASVPQYCTIPAGASKGTFQITTKAVSASTSVTISLCTPPGSFLSGGYISLTLLPAGLLSVSAEGSTVVGGTIGTGGVVFSGPVTTATTVTLSSSSPLVANPPQTVTVPAGASSALFSIPTLQVGAKRSVVFTATVGSVSVTSPPLAVVDLATISFSANPVVGGSSSTGYVTLTQPLSFAWTGQVSVDSSVASLPATQLTFNEGAPGSSFTVNTVPVAVNTGLTVSATLTGGNQLLGHFTVLAPKVAGFTLSQSSVQGSSSTAVTATITLSSKAPASFPITLTSSNNGVASVSSSVNLNGGTSITFPISHKKVTSSTPVTFTATVNGTSTKVTLTVTP